MGGDASKRNQSLYCHYHLDRGHITEDCRFLRDHLSQLVKARKLNEFLHQPSGQFGHSGVEFHRDSSPRPALETINMIFAKPGNSGCSGTRVMSVSGVCDLEASDRVPKKTRLMVTLTLSFLEEDKEGTLQPHDDTLMVTVRIGGYDVKRVLVDQGSGVEIMYPDLYKGLNLKPKDLEKYDSPLMGFDGRMVVP
nr:uncharacterized protein LOC112026670 [Quercus suber]